MFKLIRVSTALLGFAILLGLVLKTNPGDPSIAETMAPTPLLTISNPAAYYCESLGNSYHVKGSGKDQRGVCQFQDGSSCDAWEFLQGECGQDKNYCAGKGKQTIVAKDGKNSYSKNYAVCVGEDGKGIGSVTELMDFKINLVRSGCGNPAEPPPGRKDKKDFEQPSAPIQPFSVSPASLPSAFDWRSYLDSDWMTPVKDQGSCGSCWAFSAVGSAEAAFNIGFKNPDLDLDLAEQYLVSDCSYSGTCCGGWQSSALEFILDNGIPDEGCLPYVDGFGCSCFGTGVCSNCTYNTGGACSNRTCSDRCSDWENRMVKLDYVAYYPDTYDSAALKQALVDYGPFSVAMSMNGYWDENIFRCEYDGVINHSVVIAGYNDVGGYWIVKNSWGAGFGEGGYFYVGYDECSIETYVSQAIANYPAPDLTVEHITYSPANPVPGQMVDFHVRIKNQGPSPMLPGRPFYLNLYINHKPVGCSDWDSIWSWDVSPLAALESQEFAYAHTFPTPGAYDIWAYVDSTCNIKESDEENNITGPVTVNIQSGKTIEIDIKPGSYPNSINCRNSNEVIPVAVLTTDSFNALLLDPTTVTFEAASETHFDKKTGNPRLHIDDVDQDGDMDLLFHFRLDDTLLTCESTEAVLHGKTLDGADIEARDSIRMLGSSRED